MWKSWQFLVENQVRTSELPFHTGLKYCWQWVRNLSNKFLLHSFCLSSVVVLKDPGISNAQAAGTYPPYDNGMNMNVFIKKSDGSGPIIGKVCNLHFLMKYKCVSPRLQNSGAVCLNLNLDVFFISYFLPHVKVKILIHRN